MDYITRFDVCNVYARRPRCRVVVRSLTVEAEQHSVSVCVRLTKQTNTLCIKINYEHEPGFFLQLLLNCQHVSRSLPR